MRRALAVDHLAAVVRVSSAAETVDDGRRIWQPVCVHTIGADWRKLDGGLELKMTGTVNIVVRVRSQSENTNNKKKRKYHAAAGWAAA
jgi:hypothetical protein